MDALVEAAGVVKAMTQTFVEAVEVVETYSDFAYLMKPEAESPITSPTLHETPDWISPRIHPHPPWKFLDVADVDASPYRFLYLTSCFPCLPDPHHCSNY
jgi:hypothetical protein